MIFKKTFTALFLVLALVTNNFMGVLASYQLISSIPNGTYKLSASWTSNTNYTSPFKEEALAVVKNGEITYEITPLPTTMVSFECDVESGTYKKDGSMHNMTITDSGTFEFTTSDYTLYAEFQTNPDYSSFVVCSGNITFDWDNAELQESENDIVYVTGIELLDTDYKKDYYVGDLLDVSNLVVTATYSDNSTENIAVSAEMISGFDSSSAVNSQTLTVTYENCMATFEIYINQIAITVKSIDVSSIDHKTLYTVGDMLDISNLVITATYSDNSTENIAVSAEMISGFDSSSAVNAQTLTITYENCTATFEVYINQIAITVKSIEISSIDHKILYTVGDLLDVLDLVITATYSDNSTENIAVLAEMISGFDSSSAVNSQTLTITYENCTATFEIYINQIAVTVKSIDVSSIDHKILYTVGDLLDISNLVITATYSDNSTENIAVSAEMISGFDSSSAVNTQTLTITYENCTATFEIYINQIAITVKSIEISSIDHKILYTVGDLLDVSNLVITATHSDNSTENIAVSAEMISGFDSSSAVNAQTLTVTYENCTATFEIYINQIAVTVKSIDISSIDHKILYTVGDMLDISNLVITATYSDNSTENIAVLSEMISGFDSSSAVNSQTLTITYENCTATYEVYINQIAITVKSIDISSIDHKILYTVGDLLDISNLVVTATYSDNSTENIAVSAEMISGFDSSSAVNSQTLTITYENCTATFEIYINQIAITVKSIDISSIDHKTLYTVGDLLDVSNLVITATYSDNSTENIEVSAEMISGFDSSSAVNSQTLTITYENCTATFEIYINQIAITVKSIEISSIDHKILYTVGDLLDVSNLVITATYSDNSTENIAVSAEMISGFDSYSAVNSQTLTITYENCTATYEIYINQIAITVKSIDISSIDHKILYTVGDLLDVSNLVITATYSDNSTENIAVSAEMISGFDSSSAVNSQTLTVTYENCTATFEIQIDAKKENNNSSSSNSSNTSSNNSNNDLTEYEQEFAVEPDINEEAIVNSNINFIDVSSEDWYYEAINFVVQNDLFFGMSEDEFMPNFLMTRAMVLTVLHRLSADETYITGEYWYEDGVNWAIAEGISDGNNLNSNVTREELVTMLYRYNSKNELLGEITEFADIDEVSDWATEAMKWAIQTEIIQGKTEDTIEPKMNATRAEVATIIMRFTEYVDKY